MTSPEALLSVDSWQAPPAVAAAVERVRLRARLRLAWLRFLYDSFSESEVDIALHGQDTPEAEAAWVQEQASLEPVRRRLEENDATSLREGADSRLGLLASTFRLSPASLDLIHLCTAAEVAPELRTVFATLQYPQGFAHVTFWLAARLFGHSPAQWSPDDAVFLWELIRRESVSAVEPEALLLDPAIGAWLLGHTDLDASLTSSVRRVRGTVDGAHPLVGETARRLEERILDASQPKVRLMVAGGSPRQAAEFASGVCAAMGLDALLIERPPGESIEGGQFIRIQRRAFLDRAIPVWSSASADWRAPWSWFPMQIVLNADSLPASAGVEDLCVELSSTGNALPIPVLEQLAQRLECPFEREDLVVPAAVAEALDEFVYEAQNRDQLWSDPEARRLFPLGRGVVGLFTGDPGTGKTMAAQVMARRLGLSLYRIDLSALVSKWVGETSKHIAAVLHAAANAPVLLLFDEAEGLFGKRAQDQRDAQDRYVNQDTSHLLAALETFPGVAVLATNLRGNLDHAFTRRLRHVIAFPKPGPRERLEIWQRVLSALAGPAAAAGRQADMEVIAGGVEVTGAEIKNACLGAVFSARRAGEELGRVHLLQALARELTKAGRSLSERERQKLMQHGG